ncbi:MAG: tRNA (5-methylaminomethyl-2-thiouridine)(34)-methyltransferase MnmD [Bacteroidales bacterium]|nr:tRNA (5-methylaminomethyl-2-thiouridine)(34)-methyltransferase MnmD [Bacteroidales bacterium]
MKRELMMTQDGSHTIFIPELNEHYHSTHGAIAEAQHVFIQAGCQYFVDKYHDINILEIGFGTGLNAVLTEFFSQQHHFSIHYTAIEAFPLANEILQQLNYSQFDSIHHNVFDKIHQIAWNDEFQEISPNFWMQKQHIMLENYSPLSDYFDLIYFDAFAPDIQPILWEKSIFEKLFRCLKNGGILTTYSAKGEVRRNMQSVGFLVERLPGALGKREMLRAIKP